MQELDQKSPIYLSKAEIEKFSIFPNEADHLLNVDFNDNKAVHYRLQAAAINSAERRKRMQEIYEAGYIQDWPLAAEKIAKI